MAPPLRQGNGGTGTAAAGGRRVPAPVATGEG